MTKLAELTKIIFVSFEFLYLTVLLAVYQFYPAIFGSIGHKFHSNQEIWKFIPTLPTSLLVASISYTWKIITPLSGTSNRVLHEWPDYWKLKTRVILSIIYCGLSAISSIVIWFYGLQFKTYQLGFIFIATIGIPIIVLLHQVLASFVVRELMEP
ncbi:MAG: hypothetical protein ABIJ50_07695 [Pseudomonadota bacterium]